MGHLKWVAQTFVLVTFLMTSTAFAQMDFSGVWAPIRSEDNFEGHPYPGEFVGLPINDSARGRALSWEASIQTLHEWQCRPHGWGYISRGPSQLRITKEVDPVTRQVSAYHAEWLRSVDNPIYLDGRPHPPDFAARTWGGFSTATWEGDRLKIQTTNLKEEYIRRNGLYYSDNAVVTTYWTRRDNILTWTNIVYDSVYLEEPLIRATQYRLVPNQEVAPYPCTVVDEVSREKGVVPSYMPGTHPQLEDYQRGWKVPAEAAMGGRQTMYPEYQARLKELTKK